MARHPLNKGAMTAARYAAGRHVFVSRRGLDKGPLDEAWRRSAWSGDRRRLLGRAGAGPRERLIASVPERHTEKLRTGLHSFALPMALPEITVSMFWHPRMDGDPAHRWLRGCVRRAPVRRLPER